MPAACISATGSNYQTWNRFPSLEDARYLSGRLRVAKIMGGQMGSWHSRCASAAEMRVGSSALAMCFTAPISTGNRPSSMRLTRRAMRSNAAAKHRCGSAIGPGPPGFSEAKSPSHDSTFFDRQLNVWVPRRPFLYGEFQFKCKGITAKHRCLPERLRHHAFLVIR